MKTFKNYVFNILLKGQDKYSTVQELQNLAISNFIGLAAVPIISSFFVYNMSQGFFELAALDTLMITSSIACIYLNRTGYVSASIFIILFLIPLLFLTYPMFVGNINAENYNLMFLLLGLILLHDFKKRIILCVYLASLFAVSLKLSTSPIFFDHYEHITSIHTLSAILIPIGFSLCVFTLSLLIKQKTTQKLILLSQTKNAQQ